MGRGRVQDVLARRCRLPFLDARLAESAVSAVEMLVAEELGRPFDDAAVASFAALAERYRRLP